MSEQKPDKPVVPLKVNAFEHVRQANTQLAALFPYMHAGAIIPCSSQFEVAEGESVGYFVHENTVDEVGLILGSGGRGRVGDVWRGPKEHGVGFSAPHAYFSAVVITQRQSEDGEQNEAVTFKCEKCSNILIRHEFSGALESAQKLPPLPTTQGSFEASEKIESEAQRTCAACGHINPPFPAATWHWNLYVKNTRIANKAYAALRDAVS